MSEAVAGNPRAVAAARNYHDRLSTGMIAVWVGGAATVGGTVSLAGANSSTTTNQFAGSFVVVIAGLVVMAAGSLYVTSADPYCWDAINLFNDDADVQTLMPLAPPPGYAPPPGFAPPPDYAPTPASAPSAMKTSLRMRK